MDFKKCSAQIAKHQLREGAEIDTGRLNLEIEAQEYLRKYRHVGQCPHGLYRCGQLVSGN